MKLQSKVNTNFNCFGSKVFVHYIRTKNNIPVGVIVGSLYNETVYIGTSICSEGDTFNKQIGRFVAYGRMEKKYKESQKVQKLPSDLMDAILKHVNIEPNMLNEFLRENGTFHTKEKHDISEFVLANLNFMYAISTEDILNVYECVITDIAKYYKISGEITVEL